MTMPSMIRWDPFRSLSAFQEQMNRLFEDTLFRGRGNDSLTSWAPAVDIYETDSELVLRADLPEMNEKDLDIHLENNSLTISGERKFESKVSRDNYLRLERADGSFSRSFSLPTTVKPDAIKAEYKDGVLTVHLPKREEAKPKQIKVCVSSN
jgi:HSP20 family protein